VNSRDEQASADRSAARQVARAVAEREQGRRRLNATTVTVTCASVLAAGTVAAILPGSSHAAVTKTSGSTSSGTSGTSGSSGSSGSATGGSSEGSSDGSSSGSTGDQGTIQPPASPPQFVGGGGSFGGRSTSGGT
jgi:hypothetical protein